jgi:hypothetical protein
LRTDGKDPGGRKKSKQRILGGRKKRGKRKRKNEAG